MTELKRHSKVLVVGSGGNAIAAAVQLRMAGISDFRIITAHSDFGGAWFTNRYPGCGTDTKMSVYQYEFALDAGWTNTHPSREEVLGYLCRVARDHDLYERTDFDTTMTSCSWDSDEQQWSVETSQGEYTTQHLVLATGFLDEAIEGGIAGQDLFEGRIFHSQNWPDGYSGEGDRIAIVGTGSSSFQLVPSLQPIAKSITVFQRTPAWIFPKNQRDLSPEEQQRYLDDVQIVLRERAEFEEARYEQSLAQDGLNDEWVVKWEKTCREFLEREVRDPELRRILTPDYNFGCKRPGSSDTWYSAIQEPNVELVPEAAGEITAKEIVSQGGRRFEVDTIVLATGFRWGTHILTRVLRRDGLLVSEAQGGHPRAYKGIMVSKCPNLYLVGPGPNGRTRHSGLRTGELASAYVVKAIEYMDSVGVRSLEVREEVEEEWKRQADIRLARGPINSGQCTNYITDAFGCNMADSPYEYRDHIEHMNTFVASDYRDPAEESVGSSRS